MLKLKFVVTHPAGLHARPASLFVKTCNSFPCEIRVKNLTTGSNEVNAKSVLAVLTLGVDSGHEVFVSANGDKEKDALDAIKALVDTNFGEPA